MSELNLCRDAAKSLPICSRFLKSCLAWASCSASLLPRALLTTVSRPPAGASLLEGGVAVGGATAVVIVVEMGVVVGGVMGVVVLVDSNEGGMAA